jgi:hypothetical protein
MSRPKTAKTRSRDRKVADSKARPNVQPVLSKRNLNVLLCFLLATATIALYSPVIEYPFVVLDDTDYVTSNVHVHGGLSWRTIKWAFTEFTAANWHPLTWLSHALDYQLFALNPAGHHLDSVLIHALNVVLLFLVLRWVTGRVAPSLLVAALFALHPINVESVAWVAERKNVLCTFFFLAAIGAYAWYAQRPRGSRYLSVLVLFAMGLMAKPMVITLPLVLLLLDYWPLGRTPDSPASPFHAPQQAISKLLLEKIPLLAMSAASALVTMRAQRGGYAVRTLYQFPFASRVEKAMDLIRIGFDDHHSARNYLSGSSIFTRGMVLVPRDAGPRYRPGTSGRCRYGRSLRLPSVDWSLHRRCLGPGRLVPRERYPADMVDNSGSGCADRAQCGHAPPDDVLGK